MNDAGLKRGQPITFRLPSDTSDHTLKQLQKLKEVERRNFSSKIAEFVIDGVNDSLLKHREAITIPLPKGLTKAQRDWLKHEHSEALLGSIVYQLMSDPIRTASLFASLNSNAIDVNAALYLQEETSAAVEVETEHQLINIEDDLDNFDWEQLKEPEETSVVEEEDPLADFLAQMNK
ncbi:MULTISPECIES: hypothetical protein [Sporosarcina]|jgi:hypothetical protein|uniref:Plasmid segregation centromere-binding protein ParR n=1 Tax=Sporosarcina psychrophila TaxID=1476 RepID=A0ABV2K8T5_SPOPS|nr:hypothetical protein [Sporosarcina sp. resist]QNK88393.1 hypothetical protein H7992_00935 [Sporosarcina sp. resist]